jgi:hypothetical protein
MRYCDCLKFQYLLLFIFASRSRRTGRISDPVRYPKLWVVAYLVLGGGRVYSLCMREAHYAHREM